MTDTPVAKCTACGSGDHLAEGHDYDAAPPLLGDLHTLAVDIAALSPASRLRMAANLLDQCDQARVTIARAIVQHVVGEWTLQDLTERRNQP